MGAISIIVIIVIKKRLKKVQNKNQRSSFEDDDDNYDRAEPVGTRNTSQSASPVGVTFSEIEKNPYYKTYDDTNYDYRGTTEVDITTDQSTKVTISQNPYYE